MEAVADDGLVTALVACAKASVGEPRLLQQAALAPLLHIIQHAAAGLLPQSEWRERLQQLPEASGAAEMSVGELIAHLRASIPPDAHVTRLRRAMASLGNSSPTPMQLVALLQGVSLLKGSMLDIGLLRAVIEALARVAAPPLELWGLVQEPLLRECMRLLGQDLTGSILMLPTPIEPSSLGSMCCTDCTSVEHHFETEVAKSMFLEAAELARRGDQRGAKHGCLLVDSKTGTILARGFNHQVAIN